MIAPLWRRRGNSVSRLALERYSLKTTNPWLCRRWNSSIPPETLAKSHFHFDDAWQSSDSNRVPQAFRVKPEPRGLPQTSEDLIDALGELGRHYATPARHKGGFDLSYSDAGLAATDFNAALAEAQTRKAKEAWWRKNTDSMKCVLADYIRTMGPKPANSELDTIFTAGQQQPRDLLEVFSESRAWQLEKRGLDLTQIVTFAWILTAGTGDLAAFRLEMIGRGDTYHLDGKPHIPAMVLLFLLRRSQGLSPKGLRALLVYTWRHMDRLYWTRPHREMPLQRSMHIPITWDDAVGMQEYIFMMIITRLVRHSRAAWPACLPNVATLFTKHLDGFNFREKTDQLSRNFDATAALSFMYNEMLKQLAEPCATYMTLSSTYQEQAQMIVLRRMNEFDPPLPVDRRGYEAVAAVQLGQEKSEGERRWTNLQSERWPPWKEDKLGIDASIEPASGFSSAKSILDRAKMAGYSHDQTSDALEVVAGWDTDNTPTVRTRAVVWAIGKHRTSNSDFESSNVGLWCARIRATRTLDEAWSAFLSWKQERFNLRKGDLVYNEMFTKLFNKKRYSWVADHNARQGEPGPTILPGDSPFVHPSPGPASRAIHVNTPVPDIDTLFRQMCLEKVRPRLHLLCDLLENANSIHAAERYLRAAHWPEEQITGWLYEPELYFVPGTLGSRQLGKQVAASLVRLFCRLSASGKAESAQVQDEMTPSELHFDTSSSYLQHAVRLGTTTAGPNREVWHNLLHGLATSRASALNTHPSSQHLASLHNWFVTCAALLQMDKIGVSLSLRDLNVLCYSLIRALYKAHRTLKNPQELQACFPKDRVLLALVLDYGIPLVKDAFKNIVGSDPERCLGRNKPGRSALSSSNSQSSAANTPELFEIPSYRHLELYVQALGLARDYQGILALVRWMAEHRTAIDEWSQKLYASAQKRRMCMAAIRTWLERSWRERPDARLDLEASYEEERATRGDDEPARASESTKRPSPFPFSNLDDSVGDEEVRTSELHSLWETLQRKVERIEQEPSFAEGRGQDVGGDGDESVDENKGKAGEEQHDNNGQGSVILDNGSATSSPSTTVTTAPSIPGASHRLLHLVKQTFRAAGFTWASDADVDAYLVERRLCASDLSGKGRRSGGDDTVWEPYADERKALRQEAKWRERLQWAERAY